MKILCYLTVDVQSVTENSEKLSSEREGEWLWLREKQTLFSSRWFLFTIGVWICLKEKNKYRKKISLLGGLRCFDENKCFSIAAYLLIWWKILASFALFLTDRINWFRPILDPMTYCLVFQILHIKKTGQYVMGSILCWNQLLQF